MELILIGSSVLLLVVCILLLLSISKKVEPEEKQKQEDIGALIREEMRTHRTEMAEDAKRLREEIAATQKTANEALVSAIADMRKSQQDGTQLVEARIKSLVESNESRLDKMRDTINDQMKTLQDGNEKKLDQMRETVDEKLQSTLEKRLGESFKLVSDRLEAVQRGLGDMQNLATGVGDLKRMLTNVKARGTWGEFQLGDILNQVLTPDQFEANVQTKKGSGNIVEFAIKLPGQNDIDDVWLPIDAKFPQEDYQRLIDAAEIADTDAVEKSKAALLRSIEKSAKEISSKYIDPPHTTDFAILFLPTEGLYSEVLRQPGVVDKLQQEHRIVVAGPTTLSAILNSLRMGFRTLAIEKRSSEVWTVLSAVKTEFGKFGDVLAKVKIQLDRASNTIDSTTVRTRAMERKLKDVEALPVEESAELLGVNVVSEEEI